MDRDAGSETIRRPILAQELAGRRDLLDFERLNIRHCLPETFERIRRR